MRGEPIAAEYELKNKYGNAYEQTDCITAIRSEIKTYREIDKRAYDGLGYIIGQTHFAVKPQETRFVPECSSVIYQNEN